MSALEVVLAAINAFQAIALVWISAWQQKAALEIRRLNGHIGA